MLLTPAWLLAEPVPNADDRVVAQRVCEILQSGHVTRPTINAEISKRLFQRFFKDFDSSKSYFLKSDIEEFKTHETELGDMLQRGDVSFAYKVYKRFIERVGQRLPLINELVDAKHDYTVKEYLDTDVAHLDYAGNDNDLRERWRKRIKFDLLREKIGAKPLGDAEARQKVRTIAIAASPSCVLRKATRQLRSHGALSVELGRQPRSAWRLHVAEHAR